MAEQKSLLKIVVTVIAVLLIILVGIFGYLNAKGEKLNEGQLRIRA